MSDTPWPAGPNRADRLQDVLRRHRFDALVAVTPENAHYLARHGNYLATHWRVPGIFTGAVGMTGARSVVIPDFGADSQQPAPYSRFPFTSWIESIDIRNQPPSAPAARIRSARPESLDRPAQFDLDDVWDQVAAAIRSVAPRPERIGMDLREVDAFSVEQLLERLPGVLIEDATDQFDNLRALKDPDEIAWLRQACRLTEIGIAGAVERLRPGMSASAVSSAYQIAVHEEVVKGGFPGFQQAEGLASVGMGADRPKVVEPGQTIKFDQQVDMAGYHSDIGRTYAWHPTPEQRDIHDALHRALLALQAAVRPGISFAELHATGTAAMADQGFSTYSRGHLGHSDGLTQHFEEPPFIAPSEMRRVAPGMVLSIELPYYIYGAGAFQLERMLEITTEGCLTMDDALPFELAIDLDNR